MPVKKTNYFDQLKQLGYQVSQVKGIKNTKNEKYGGIATYDEEQDIFNILKSGTSSHIELQCLEKVDDLVGRGMLNYDDQLYLFLNTAPCTANNNNTNCLDRIIKWAKINPNKKLVLGFQKPSANGSHAESMSDKEKWFMYRMDLMCRTFPTNLTIVSLYNTEIFHSHKNNSLSDRVLRASVLKSKFTATSFKEHTSKIDTRIVNNKDVKLKLAPVKKNNFMKIKNLDSQDLKKEIHLIRKLMSLRKKKDELILDASPPLTPVGSGLRRHKQLEPLIKIF